MNTPLTIPLEELLFSHPLSGGEWSAGRLLELTDRGFFVGTNVIWPPETPLTVVLRHPGERHPVRMSGKVSWARVGDPSGMFVVFAEGMEELSARQRPELAGSATSREPAPEPPRTDKREG